MSRSELNFNATFMQMERLKCIFTRILHVFNVFGGVDGDPYAIHLGVAVEQLYRAFDS